MNKTQKQTYLSVETRKIEHVMFIKSLKVTVRNWKIADSMFILDLAYCLIMMDQIFNIEYMCNFKGNYGFLSNI